MQIFSAQIVTAENMFGANSFRGKYFGPTVISENMFFKKKNLQIIFSVELFSGEIIVGENIFGEIIFGARIFRSNYFRRKYFPIQLFSAQVFLGVTTRVFSASENIH